MYNGWVKNHRKILEWEWYTTPNMYHVFSTLVLLANHDEKKWKGQTIKRGQLITGFYSLSKLTGISVQSLRTCIKRLKSTSEITSKSTNKFSLITIANYNNYQSTENSQQANQQAHQQTTNKQLTTNKNVRSKEDKEIYIDHQKVVSFNELLKDFKIMRNKIKKPLTDRALKTILNELKSHHVNVASKMLENAIVHNWQKPYTLDREEANSLIPTEKPKETEHFTQEQIESNKLTISKMKKDFGLK